jgi:hypothetical protein
MIFEIRTEIKLLGFEAVDAYEHGYKTKNAHNVSQVVDLHHFDSRVTMFINRR